LQQPSHDLELRASDGCLLSLVIPVYNEAETVAIFSQRVKEVLHSDIGIRLEIIFVNDGSNDDTLLQLLELQKQSPEIKIVDLSRNFGKEAALTAGIDIAEGNAVVPIDVDLQDPPELIPQMLDKWRDGYDVVLARRTNRESDTWMKRISSAWFYKIHNKIAEQPIPENAGDFRLMDRSVIVALKSLPESRRFMKGLFAWVGFRTTEVQYARPERVAGLTKFNGWRLWNFALEGVTSFSTEPLRVWTYIGGLVALLAAAFAMSIIIEVWVYGVDVPGYASLIVTISFLGGLQLIGIGMLGEYLGRTYIEAKRRPVYLIRRVYDSAELASRAKK